jgi:hypothetical protein
MTGRPHTVRGCVATDAAVPAWSGGAWCLPAGGGGLVEWWGAAGRLGLGQSGSGQARRCRGAAAGGGVDRGGAWRWPTAGLGLAGGGGGPWGVPRGGGVGGLGETGHGPR